LWCHPGAPRAMKRFTSEEKAIWNAAYAAAFVAEFNKMREVSNWDRADALVSAEAPITLADTAVERLREWRSDEDATAGKGHHAR
jgi:hypothetical protein